MITDEPGSWADVYKLIIDQNRDLRELVSREHDITSQKIEGLRTEGRMRESTLMTALSRTESNTRAYADDLHKDLKENVERGYQAIQAGVEKETACLQVGLDTLHVNIFGNGNLEHSLAYRVKITENEQAEIQKVVGRWEKIVIGILSAFGVPMTLGLLALIWLFIIGKAELILH